ncbi:MAG: hypothetical protein K0R06_3461 [Clostridium sp.]|jgi:hypothetical protein|nr:hypothetical protein [Clostridium sp.]
MNIINSNLQFRNNQLAYGNKPDTIVLHCVEIYKLRINQY